MFYEVDTYIYCSVYTLCGIVYTIYLLIAGNIL